MSIPSRVRSHGFARLLALFLALFSGACSNDPTPPPLFTPGISIVMTPPEDVCITPGQSVDFSVTASNGEPPFTYEWVDLDFGTVIVNKEDPNAGPLKFDNVGTFRIRCEVTDAKGKKNSRTRTVSVKLDCNLQAHIDGPANDATLHKGDPITFQGRGTGGSPPYTYEWDWEDDGTFDDTGENPTHSFDTNGTYHVVLKVTDFTGSAAYFSIRVFVTDGLSGIDPRVTSPDDVVETPPDFANVVGGSALIIGSDGAALIDVGAKVLFDTYMNGVSFDGAVAIRASKGLPVLTRSSGGPGVVDAVFGYNFFETFICYWNAAADSFEAPIVVGGNGGADVSVYGDDPTSGGLVYVGGSVLQTYDYSGTTGLFERTLSTVSTKFPGHTSGLASAYARADTGSIIVITGGNPGQIYLHDRNPSADATLVGASLNGGEEIRCMDDVCVISNTGSDSLTVLTWDQLNNVTVVGHVPVGFRPTTISLMRLGNNDIAVACPGSGDDTLWITVLSPTGALVSNNSVALPFECSGAKGAMWIPGTTDVMVNCVGSDNLYVMASGL